MLASTTPFTWMTDPVINACIGIASLAIGIIGVAIGYWFYYKGKSIKRITYEIVSDTLLVRFGGKVGKGEIKVEYEDNNGHIEEIKRATLLTLRVWNSGNTDIKIWNASDQDIEDMEEPIEFELDKRTIVSLTEVKTYPPEGVIYQKYLGTYLNKPFSSPSSIGLPHCLLKPKQFIELVTLLKGTGSEIELKGKLINGEIEEYSDIENYRSNRIIVLSVVITLLILFGCLMLIFSILPDLRSYEVLTTGGTFLLVWWVAYRIGHPFRCSCGFSTLFAGTFRKHLMRFH